MILSYNNLSEIEFGTFSALGQLQTLDLSTNELEDINYNIITQISHQLQSLDIGNNQLKEFNSFTRWNVSNVKIVGIDTNQLNCRNIKHIFEKLSWKNFDSLTVWVNCGIQNEDIDSDVTSTLAFEEISLQTTQDQAIFELVTEKTTEFTEN